MTEQQHRAYRACFVGSEMHIGAALHLRPARCRGWRRFWNWRTR